MKIILKIDSDINLKYIPDAIEKSKFDITEVITDSVKAEAYIKDLKLDCRKSLPDWNNIDRAGANVQTNKWGKKYDKDAAKHNDEMMLSDAEALIYIGQKPYIAKTMKDAGKPVFEYNIQKNLKPEDYGYQF